MAQQYQGRYWQIQAVMAAGDALTYFKLRFLTGPQYGMTSTPFANVHTVLSGNSLKVLNTPIIGVKAHFFKNLTRIRHTE